MSWRTDVTSKQEKYVVVYTRYVWEQEQEQEQEHCAFHPRNDTAKTTRIQTTEKGASLSALFPGAGYDIQVGTADGH